MISHQYKCIFLHIPKCAGTSIEKVFGHLDGYTGRGGQDHRSLRMIENPMSALQMFSSPQNIREVVRRFRYDYRENSNVNNKLKVTPEQFRDYYKFTIVRNPWARVFSWYHNVMRDPVHLQNHGISKEITLPDFLKRYVGKNMLRPQTYWIKNFNGQVALDCIIRFENIDSEYKDVANALQVPNIELPRLNKGRTQNYQEYYDNAAINLVLKTYQEEIDMFGYSFDQ